MLRRFRCNYRGCLIVFNVLKAAWLRHFPCCAYIDGAVEPADGKIVAPCDGEVSNIFETGHAVCITTEAGGELLIHIGIDTVKMDGKGFTKKVSDGDKVHAGDILVETDLEEIKNAGYQTTTMMILTNTDEFGNVTKAEPAEVKTTSKVMTLTK